MPARYDEEKGYIVELSSRKQFADLIEKGAIGVESIDKGMFYVVLNFSFKDGDAANFKKHGNNYYNKTRGLGNYRQKPGINPNNPPLGIEEDGSNEPPLSTEPPYEGEELVRPEEPQTSA